MKRVKIVVAYDGTMYCGWQVQENGITVEEILNKKLSELLREDIIIIGASRTDSGVHALGNVAVFDTESRIPPEKMSYALNQRLPEDIVIQHSCEVPLDWHPRYQDCSKTYEYKIYNHHFPNPLARRYSHFVYYPLDIEKMQQAADFLKGEHDFKSFCSKRGQQLTSVSSTARNCLTTERIVSIGTPKAWAMAMAAITFSTLQVPTSFISWIFISLAATPSFACQIASPSW